MFDARLSPLYAALVGIGCLSILWTGGCRTLTGQCEIPESQPAASKTGEADSLENCSGTIHLVYLKDPGGWISYNRPAQPLVDNQWLEKQAEMFRQVGLDATVHEPLELREVEQQKRGRQYTAKKLLDRLHAEFAYKAADQNQIIIGVTNAHLRLEPDKKRQFRLSARRESKNLALVSGYHFGSTEKVWEHRLRTEIHRHVGRLLCEYSFSRDSSHLMYRDVDNPSDLDCIDPNLRTAEQ